MYTWKEVFRRGLVPQFSTPGLEALKKALETDDPRLLQEETATPSPTSLQSAQDWPTEAACPVAYPGWQGDGLATVADTEQRFAQVCHDADNILLVGKGQLGVGFFTSWWDDTPREEARLALLTEVSLALAEREKQHGQD